VGSILDSSSQLSIRDAGPAVVFRHPAGLLSRPSQSLLRCHKSTRPSRLLPGTAVAYAGWNDRQPKGSVAVFQGSNIDAISRLRLGEENDGWRVQGINLRSIVVEKGAQSVKLDLPRPQHSAGAIVVSNIPRLTSSTFAKGCGDAEAICTAPSRPTSA
jgi:hypothetical protein